MVTALEERAQVGLFHLVTFVDGEAVPFVPYASGCGSCCTAEVEVAPTSTGCCCH